VTVENLPHLSAEVAFHLENQGADSEVFVACLECQNLFGKRIHCRRGLARPDRSEDDGSGEQSALGIVSQ